MMHASVDLTTAACLQYGRLFKILKARAASGGLTGSGIHTFFHQPRVCSNLICQHALLGSVGLWQLHCIALQKSSVLTMYTYISLCVPYVRCAVCRVATLSRSSA